jgi:hypothetical protein
MEHRQHLFDYLPFLILLLCPVMHMFMHGGHGDHDDHEGHQHTDGSVDMDAYRRGYDDALKESQKKADGEEKPNAR